MEFVRHDDNSGYDLYCAPSPHSQPHEQNRTGPGLSAQRWLFDIAREQGYVRYASEEFCSEGSPFALQGSLYDLESNSDFSLGALYCRLAELQASQQLSAQERSIQSSHHPDCIGGEPRYEWPLKLASSLWDSYPDAPKIGCASPRPAPRGPIPS